MKIVFACSGIHCDVHDNSTSLSSSGRLSPGGVAALVVAGVIGLLAVLLAVVGVELWRVRRRRKYSGRYLPSRVEKKAGTLPLHSLNTTGAMQLVYGSGKNNMFV